MGSTAFADGNEGSPFGVMFNPKDFPWTKQECNVDHGEEARVKRLRDKWYGVAHVGDGADAVAREDLDAWQKFAHDVVMDPRHKPLTPLRLMLMGSAGTGKSRTVRAFVTSKRARARRDFAPVLERTRLRAQVRAEAARQRRRSGGVAQNLDERIANVAYLLGASDERAKEVVAMHDAAAEKSKEAKRKAAVDDAVEAAVAIALKEVEAEVRDVCLLSAPTGCASFQLKFGASTLHRAFGVPVGYCGPWKNRADGRFRKMKTRMDQAKFSSWMR